MMNVRKILEVHYPPGEYVLMPEVSCGNGYMDWIAVGLWNSRGFPIIGHEQKSFRSDWLRELKKPAKQESHFRYLNQMYLLTDNENVAKLDEIPAPWGWKHIKGDRVYTMKKAPQLKPEPIPKSFLTALLRRAASKENYVHVDDIKEQIQERAEQIKNSTLQTQKREAEAHRILKEKVEAFEKASGLSLSIDSWDSELPNKLGQAVRVVMNNGVDGHLGTLERFKRQVDNVQDGLERSINEIKEFRESKV